MKLDHEKELMAAGVELAPARRWVHVNVAAVEDALGAAAGERS
jgi:hypothetical protein